MLNRTHTHTLSLSLSLSHTHTHTGTDESEFNEESIKAALTGLKDKKLLAKYDDFDVEGNR
jgi:hypothetical protein